jgi:hypothetical protein
MLYPNLLGGSREKKKKKRKLLGPEMVQLKTDKVRVIRERVKEAQDRQKKKFMQITEEGL